MVHIWKWQIVSGLRLHSRSLPLVLHPCISPGPLPWGGIPSTKGCAYFPAPWLSHVTHLGCLDMSRADAGRSLECLAQLVLPLSFCHWLEMNLAGWLMAPKRQADERHVERSHRWSTCWPMSDKDMLVTLCHRASELLCFRAINEFYSPSIKPPGVKSFPLSCLFWVPSSVSLFLTPRIALMP